MADSDRLYTILMVDDDAEDCQLLSDALSETGRAHNLRFVRDGEEMFDYLRHRGEYEDERAAPRPDLILLDFKMPRKDGREALREIKADPQLRRIPVVALTTSTVAEEITFAYDAGANSFIAKPTTFRQWVEITKILSKYWFEVAQLPPVADSVPWKKNA
jgi:CheY-like chemotaxis protein